jgi:glycosyltransferase involved in cell wall biosynthesis
MGNRLNISLVIPVYNEGKTILQLISSILNQSRLPDEVVFVDGGSMDDTISYITDVQKENSFIKLVKVKRAMPGKGRNIGAQNAAHEWIAFTDGGIKLDTNWLAYLEKEALSNSEASIVYGNYSPRITNLFEKCAAIAYVSPDIPHAIRGKFIASSLFHKNVLEKSGWFPDWRAAEDLALMEKAAQNGFQNCYAPRALVTWELRQSFKATFKRFDLYSKYNVWAGRQSDWHYGVLRQYIFLLLFCLLGFFHHFLWFGAIPVWFLLRAAKRIWMHRNEFGIKSIFNPIIVFLVTLHLIIIDAATFSGWLKAIFNKSSLHQPSVE